MDLKAYEGPEKYIFVSYAHKDREKVFRIISLLEEKGYRLWYDEGITPGSEWADNIAQHLDRCSAFIVFITPNSVASANCRREITFAQTRYKPFLSVFLGETEMSLGLELQLSSYQSVFCGDYPNETDFLQKICTCTELDSCKKEPEKKPEEGSEEQPENPENDDNGTTVTVRKKNVKLSKAEKADFALKTKNHRKTGNRHRIVAVIAAALVVIAAAVGIGIAANRTTVAGNTVKKSDTRIYLIEKVISCDDVSKINQLKKLNSICIVRCEFEPGAAEELSSAARYISITDSTGIDSFDFLANLKNLSSLTICNSGLKQIPDLTEFDLETVILSDNSEFDAVDMLPLADVETLDISGTAVTDLSPLNVCENLKMFYCRNNGVSDISMLAVLPDLSELDFSGCKLTAVTEKFTGLYLAKLNLADNLLADVSGFGDMTVLKELDLSGNKLTSVPWAGKNTGTLTVLSLSGNPMDASALNFIKDCRLLRELYLDDIAMNDLSLCADMSELEKLSAVHCGINDISALKNCEKLNCAYLALNNISDIPAFPNSAFEGYDAVLDLACNNIKDVSPLNGRKINCVALQYNPVSVDSESFSGFSGSVLAVDYTEGLDTCCLAERKVFGIYLADCPGDKQIALKDALGKNVKFVTREEQTEALNGKINYEKWQDLMH